MNIYKELESLSKHDEPWQPQLFNLKKSADEKKVTDLLTSKQVQRVSDDYVEQLLELYAINNPSKVYNPDFAEEAQAFVASLTKKHDGLHRHGNWVFYPWLSSLVHVLPDEDFQKVRTARNKHLITHDEQEKFYNSTVGIAGLSVGNNVALSLVLQGGAKHIKLADMDRLALTNINRIRAGVQNLGAMKAEMTARQIYEINPYAEVELFLDGLNEDNLDAFFGGKHPIRLVIDEIDNLAVKYLIRTFAKKYKVALIMGADNGDNAVLDIERYDLKPNTPFFQGRIGKVTYEQLKSLNKFEIGRTIASHIGIENVTERTLDSLKEMGKTIVSWPQLGDAAMLNGVALAYLARKIVNNQKVENNRALLSLDEKLEPDYHSTKAQNQRKKASENFRKIFGL